MSQLTSEQSQLIESVKQMSGGVPCEHHWMLALIAQHRELAESLAPDLHAETLVHELHQDLINQRYGLLISEEVMLNRAKRQAFTEGRDTPTIDDLCAAILTSSGFLLRRVERVNPDFKPGTSTLKRYGRCLTDEAAQGKLPEIMGRSSEMQILVETLCRQTKRNPVLIGPAGVGKTAIVEGLAIRIAKGEVPLPLRGVSLWPIDPQSLVAASGANSDFVRQAQALIHEASQPGILLFIDEAHAIVGAGGQEGRSDLATLLKPALARGEMACIAATTDEEYRRIIEPDLALDRRFQPIRVQALNPQQTLSLLMVKRDLLATRCKVEVSDGVLKHLVDLASHHMRNRQFPDKAVDLLEQCVAHAMALEKSNVDEADALEVVQRMVGMPMDLEAGIERLRLSLHEEEILTAADTDALLHRLRMSLSGLDMRPERPNATVLLISHVAHHAARLAELVAEALYGAADRVVAIDLGRMLQPQDITLLLGAPPGYVGFNEMLAIHRVAQMPWCVLYLQNVDQCHPQIRDAILQSIKSGLMVDARGKRIYLSDTVVILTADGGSGSERTVGLRTRGGEIDSRAIAERALDEDFVEQMDEVFAHSQHGPGGAGEASCGRILADLASRCALRSISLSWDESFLQWMLDLQQVIDHPRKWEREVEENLSSLLSPYLQNHNAVTLTLTCCASLPSVIEHTPV